MANGLNTPKFEFSSDAMFKWSEYDRWMRQAEKNLRSALRDLEGEDYEWASFKAQQAAELAVKALLRAMGFAPIGHSITRLLRALRDEGVEVPRDLFHRAVELDRNYIAPRYPTPILRALPSSTILRRWPRR
ncbi:HEPN domain-containing protein [Thermococcus sp.]